jgi:hypothetical protein
MQRFNENDAKINGSKAGSQTKSLNRSQLNSVFGKEKAA